MTNVYEELLNYYSGSSVEKVVGMHAKQRTTNKWHISATTGNSKCGCQILTVNFPAGVTCASGAPCTKFCYALKGRQIMGNVYQAYVRNLLIWQENPDQYWRELEAAIVINGVRMVRLFDCGDIPEIDWLFQLKAFAEKHPEITFSGFTKKYHFLTMVELPENVIIRCSKTGNPEWDAKIPEGYPVADIKFSEDQKMDGFHCTCKNTCSACGVCFNSRVNVWFDLH